MKTVFYIARMDCPTEEAVIRNRLSRLDRIEQIEFDLMSRRLTVLHQHDDETVLKKALESIGMDPKIADNAEPIVHGPAVSILDRWMMGLSGAAAVAAEAIAWGTGNEASVMVVALALCSMAAGGRDTIRKGIVSVQTLTLNINFLMTIAIVGAALIGQWPEAAMVTFLFGLAEMVEAYSLDRARHAIRSLMEMSPERALVLVDGKWTELEASAIRVGQLIRVRPGERIALDGVIKAGSSTVNQAPITGESMPQEKAEGDLVFAGTINQRGTFDFEVTASSSQTTLSRIIRAIQSAQSQKAPTQRFVDRFATYYTPVVVVLALLVAVAPPILFGESFSTWIYKALVLLVIACPCALVISTPVTVVSALAAAAKQGILVKGGAYMEEGHRLTWLALDKTGTLTHGLPAVTDVVATDSTSEAELLRLAASLDAPSEHPVAVAIVAHFKGELASVHDFESITGKGVKGVVEGKQYFLGNHRLAHEKGYCSPSVESLLERFETEGKTAVVLGLDDSALGIIAVADTVRETSVDAIRELHELGVRTLMLTGDNERTAAAIGKLVKIDDTRGNLLPEDKLQIVTDLKATGEVVGMVGDGVNDAPALAIASIGFAMGAAGTDTAIETADVALMQDDLRRIPEFVRLSRRASAVLRQNIVFAITVKATFFILAFFGLATLWMAVFADLGASLLVVANGLRLIKAPPSPS